MVREGAGQAAEIHGQNISIRVEQENEAAADSDAGGRQKHE